jgi:hypothetical protein
MWAVLRGLYWRVLARLSSQARAFNLARRKAKALKEELEGKLTDKLAEVLLFSMEVAFILIADYRRNLRGFHGSYVVCTADNKVAASAVFSRQKMRVKTHAVRSPTVTITFKDSAALRRFLSSKDYDILASLLANEVHVDGNLNYVYKFGFMARELLRRLGFA